MGIYNDFVKKLCENLRAIIERNLDLNNAKFIDDVSQEKLGHVDTHNIFYINRELDVKLDAAYKKALECRQQYECIRKYLSDLIQSFTRVKYLGSNIFNGRFVLGKKIIPLKGKTGIVLGNFNFIIN